MRNNKQKGFTLRRFIATCMAMLVMLGANGTALTAEGQQTPGTGDETVTETVTQPSPETTEELNDEPTGDPTGDQKKEDQPEGQTEGKPEDSEESKEPIDNPGTDLNTEGNAAPADNNQEGTPEAKEGESEDKTVEYTVTDSLPEAAPEAAPAELAESKLTVAPKVVVKEEPAAKEPAAEAEKEPAEEEENEEEKSEEQPMTLMSQPVGASLLSESSAPVTQPDVSGSKKASPTELTPNQRETTVTLSLPSGEYKNKVDVVFVTDSSNSTDLGKEFIDASTELFESIIENNPSIDLKVGVVLFTGSANDAIKYTSNGSYSGLTPYNEDTKAYITNSFQLSDAMDKDTFRDAFGRGSGPHVGLDLANMWLEADSEVEDSHKYVVFFTDGKGYIWANENHEPTTIYAQYYTNNKYTLASGGKPTLSQTMGYNKASYSVDVQDPSGKSNIYLFDSYEALYNSTDPELTGVTEWDQPCPYAFGETYKAGQPDGTIVKHATTNGADLFGTKGTFGNRADYQYWYEFTPNASWEGVKYQEGNPYMVIDNGDGTYTFDTNAINPNYYQYHVDCLQKGLYKTGHLWKEMGQKYKVATITYDSSTGGGLELVAPFKNWLRENSLYSANKSNPGDVKILFEDIDNSIRYMVNTGTVTDIVPSDFTLVEDDGFTMTKSGETLPVEKTGDHEWSFGTKNAEGVYPYVVNYDNASQTITWAINVPIENANPVTLSYTLYLKEGAEDGNSYDTNVNAVLHYTTSDGKDGKFEFEVPKVTYSEPKPTPTPTPTPTSKPTPTPEPESNPKSTPTPTPDYVVTCQMAGYPADYVWNESVKACVPGFRRTKVPNTYDKGLMGNFTTFLISDLIGIAAVLLLKKY